MNYLDVYYSRINHLGQTTAERIRGGGIRSFQRWLEQSPHTIRQLSVQRGLWFDGIILTSKDKQYQKIMFLNVANEIPITVGDILNWKQDNGDIQKWLLVQEEKKVNGTYRTFWIVRCNYLMRWVDGDGHIQESWSYFVSSVDSKIKGNFRTWNNLITPQPNKYAELLMPRYPINRGTNFIVQQESWMVVEYDHTSVPGVIYLSLTQNKINSIYDDVPNNLADTDKIASYSLLIPQETQVFTVGSKIEPKFTLMKNGEIYQSQVEYVSSNKTIAKIVNNELTAVGEGTVQITIRLKDHPEIENTITITVGPQQQEFSAYIKGNNNIRLDREEVYQLVGTSQITGQVRYSVDNTLLATVYSIDDLTCIVHANNKNRLGEIVLTAEYDGKNYTKTISIIPLW